jgi:hypothetical protein
MADESQQGMQQNSIEQQVSDAQNIEQGKDPAVNDYNQVAGMISDLDRRLRVLEERYGNMRKKIQLTDQNIIESERSFGKELRGFGDELLELKRNTNDFSDKILAFDSEMDNVAKKSDTKVIEKYLEMWNPKSFVTRKELREYLKSKNITLAGDSEESDEEEDER